MELIYFYAIITFLFIAYKFSKLKSKKKLEPPCFKRKAKSGLVHFWQGLEQNKY